MMKSGSFAIIVTMMVTMMLVGCSTPEPVLVRPELPADLFVCEPAPRKPARLTGAELVNRSNEWAAAYGACQCQLSMVRDLVEGREIEPTDACPTS